MFGKRLAEIRNKKGISQYELAEHLKFTRAQLANYEQGKREPDFETLITLADFFDVSIDYLLGRIDQPTSNAAGDYRNALSYFGNKEDLTEEEAEFLKEILVTYRKVKAKF